MSQRLAKSLIVKDSLLQLSQEDLHITKSYMFIRIIKVWRNDKTLRVTRVAEEAICNDR